MRDTLRRLGILLFGVSSTAAEGDGSIDFLRKYRLLNLIPGIGAFVLFPMGLMAYAQGYRTIAAFNLVVSGYLVLAIGYVRRTGREQGAVAGGIALITVYFYYLFATGGTFHAGHVWFFLLSLIAFFLLGSRRGIAAASLVLLAEDNRVNQEVVAGVLAVFGLPLTLVENGREAVEAWRSGEFDLILMDCQMPEMDGYEAARRISAEERSGAWGGRRTPIVALTANALAGDRGLSLSAGMDDHLGKPFRIAQLEAVLGRWLKPAA